MKYSLLIVFLSLFLMSCATTSKEEKINAIDMGDYFKVPADKRDLNYDKYFTEGDDNILDVSEYNSHNTDRLEVTEIVDKLLELDYIQEELLGWNKQP